MEKVNAKLLPRVAGVWHTRGGKQVTMAQTSKRKARGEQRTGTRVAAHLASSPHEFAITEFEQGLICAAEAFYRFYGSLLGRAGRIHKLSGQDNVILQQIMAASRPLSVADIARFGNRDDTANIQYSLKKLVRADLIRKSTASSSRRLTSYEATKLARLWTQQFLQTRKELLTDPTSRLGGFDDDLAACSRLLNAIAGFYDHGARIVHAREQKSVDPDVGVKAANSRARGARKRRPT